MGKHLRLVVSEGAELGREFLVPESGADVGRERTCDVVLSGIFVAPVHCRISKLDDKWIIEDKAGSSDGTLVDGERVDRCELSADKVIRLGFTKLVVTGEQAEGTKPEPPVSGETSATVAPSRGYTYKPTEFLVGYASPVADAGSTTRPTEQEDPTVRREEEFKPEAEKGTAIDEPAVEAKAAGVFSEGLREIPGFQIPRGKIPPRISRVTIGDEEELPVAAATPPPIPAPVDQKEWYYRSRNGLLDGPQTMQGIMRAIWNGDLAEPLLVWKTGMEEYKPARNLSDFEGCAFPHRSYRSVRMADKPTPEPEFGGGIFGSLVNEIVDAMTDKKNRRRRR